MSDLERIDLNRIEFLCGTDCSPANLDQAEAGGKADTKLVRQLRQVDSYTGNNPDGYVETWEIQKSYPNVNAMTVFDEWVVRAAKLEGQLIIQKGAQLDLAQEPALVRSLISEANPQLKLNTTRLEIVEEILMAATAGYCIRDLTAANDGLVGLVDFLSWPVRKPIEWLAEEKYSVGSIEQRSAKHRSQLRAYMVTDFMLGLDKLIHSEKKWDTDTLAGAMDALAKSIESQWLKADLRDSTHGVGSRADKRINFSSDFQLQQLAKILTLPAGQVHELSQVSAAMAREFLDEKNNWAVARFLSEQIEVAAVQGASAQSLTQAQTLIKEIDGNANNYSSFWANILPPFWAYSDLPAAQRYTLAADMTGFILPFFIAGPTFNATSKTASFLSSTLAKTLLPRVPRFERFLALTAEASPQRIAQATELLDSAIASGVKTLGADEQTLKHLKFLVQSEPGYVVKLAARGVTIDPALLAQATRQLELQTLVLGPRMKAAARALGWTGDKTYRLWNATFGKIGRGLSSIVPFAVALGKLTAQGAANVPKVGKLLARVANISGDVLVTLGRGVQFNWRGQIVCWWGLQAMGEPFIRGMNPHQDDHALPGSAQLNKAMLAMREEIQIRHLGSESIIIKELDGRLEDYLKSEETSSPYLLDQGQNPTQSRATIREKLINAPALAELGLVFINDQATTEVSSEYGVIKKTESLPLTIKPLSPVDNQKAFQEALAYTTQLNQNELSASLDPVGETLTKYFGASPTKPGQLPSNLKDFFPNRNKASANPVPVEAFDFMVVNLGGKPYLVMMHPQYASAIAAVLGG